MHTFGLLIFFILMLFNVRCTPYTSDCNEKLLENRESVPDSSFSQSSYEDNFKGKYARDSLNEEQAWCPLRRTGTLLKEFVSIDLGQLCVIKMLMTRGRNAVGYVSAQSYVIKHKQENESEWKFYRNYSGSKDLISRKDPLIENFISLEPPLIARWIRIYPYQPTNEKICLKLQFYGCINTNHVVEYVMQDGSKYLPGMGSNKFKDITYDGKLIDNGTLIGGIGKLADRDTESNSELTPIVDGAKKFVGWDRAQLKTPVVTIVFRFDSPRNFTLMALRVANHFDYDIRVFKAVTVTFGWGRNGLEIVAPSGRQSATVDSDDRMMTSRWIEIDIKGQVGTFVRIDLQFGSQWLILSEVNFQSEFLEKREDPIFVDSATEKTSPSRTRNQISNDTERWNTITTLPLTHALALICGILGVIILLGSLVLVYLHRKRKLNSPNNERINHLKFTENENQYLGNDNQFYSSKFTKGTIIPFNISPYKSYTTYKNPVDISSYNQSLRTTPNHNIINFPTPNLLLKSPPNNHSRGIDSCIYTSLPASDSDSVSTPDHKVPNNKHQFVSHNFTNSPRTPGWNNQSFRRSEQFDKDSHSHTFQCHPESTQCLDVSTMGLIYTNQDHSQDYESFMTQTFNDTDDDTTGSLFYHGSSDFNLPNEEVIIGCCGNSTMMSLNSNGTHPPNPLVHSMSVTNGEDLVPLGTGRWGDLIINISVPSNLGYHFEDLGTNGSKSKAVLVKILDGNSPQEIRERFCHEYGVLSQIKHEGLSRVLAATIDLTSKHQMIISEYSLHGNLHSYFQNLSCSSKFKFFDSTLNLDGQNILKDQQSTMSIILQIAEALNYLSHSGIVHRDVACRNCIICNVSNRCMKIKIADSAMSQVQYRWYYVRPCTVLSQASAPSSLLHSASVSAALLPLRWSSCEAIRYTTFSTKTDVYAFGMTVWEIYNRCRLYPMAELTDEQIILNAIDNNHSNMNSVPSLSLLPNCAKEIIDLIHQCIDPNPRIRPNFQDICTFIHNKISNAIL